MQSLPSKHVHYTWARATTKLWPASFVTFTLDGRSVESLRTLARCNPNSPASLWGTSLLEAGVRDIFRYSYGKTSSSSRIQPTLGLFQEPSLRTRNYFQEPGHGTHQSVGRLSNHLTCQLTILQYSSSLGTSATCHRLPPKK